jgi:hypothetical protein
MCEKVLHDLLNCPRPVKTPVYQAPDHCCAYVFMVSRDDSLK